jgi:hypothetical protein
VSALGSKPDDRVDHPVTPTADWLAEQEAKQARYAARRRAWTRMIDRRAMPEADGPDAPEEPAQAVPVTGTAAEGGGQAGKARRARGVVHDPRQRGFEF